MSQTSRVDDVADARPKTKGEVTKRALMDAAKEEFTSEGYIVATVPKIAAQAGKSPATFYKYFDNKQQVLEALLSEFFERFDTLVPRFEGSDLSRFTTIRDAVGAFWAVYREFRAEWKAVAQAATLDSQLLDVWMRFRDKGVRRIVPIVQAWQENGAPVAEHDPAVVASHLSAMVEHSAYLWLGLDASGIGRPDSDQEAVDALALLWWRALASESG